MMQTTRPSNRHRALIGLSQNAFTRTDLVVIIATIAVLAGILLPALSEIRPNDQTIACLNNGRQIVLGWNLYANDNHGGVVTPLNDYGNQTFGRPVFIDGEISSYSNLQNTNINVITNGPLYSYTQKALDIYKCPSDESATGHLPGDHAGTPRIRSISMNSAFDFGGWLPSSKYRIYAKTTELVIPSKTFVIADENPDSINDDSFAVEMVDPSAHSGRIVDIPSNLHNGSAVFTFAYGHAEAHRWLSPSLRKPVFYGGLSGNFLSVSAKDGSLQDAQWLSEHTTVAK